MEHPDPKAKYKNMRAMAWIAFFASILYPLLLLTGSDKVVELAPYFYGFTGSLVVVGYFGVTNARDGWGKA